MKCKHCNKHIWFWQSKLPFASQPLIGGRYSSVVNAKQLMNAGPYHMHCWEDAINNFWEIVLDMSNDRPSKRIADNQLGIREDLERNFPEWKK